MQELALKVSRRDVDAAIQKFVNIGVRDMPRAFSLAWIWHEYLFGHFLFKWYAFTYETQRSFFILTILHMCMDSLHGYMPTCVKACAHQLGVCMHGSYSQLDVHEHDHLRDPVRWFFNIQLSEHLVNEGSVGDALLQGVCHHRYLRI